jgi:hypothetical protein
VSFVENPSDLGGGLSYLRGVARFSGVLPAAEICCQAGLALDVDIDGPLGDESPERGKIGALPGLVGRLVQLPREGGERGRRDLTDGLP